MIYDGQDLELYGEPPAPRPTRPAWSRRLRRVTLWLLLLMAAYYALCVPLLVAYRFVDPPVTGVQVQRRLEAALSGTDREVRRQPVEYARISRHLMRAVVTAEDRHFWSHWGFDLGEMRASAGGALQGQRPRGASTITQQLIKNLFGTTHRNPVRKLYDLSLTPAAEVLLGKQRILELYLNNVEWGEGIFGAEAAARHHYGVSATALSRAQAAGLAALLPNPRRRTPANTTQYRATILRRMAARGW